MTYLQPGIPTADRQQLNKIVTANSDANGNATFTFEEVPPGYAWAGNVQVIGAPSGAVHVVSVADVQWGTMIGTLPFGTIHVPGRLECVITSTGLAPSTQYSANFLGVSDDAIALPPILPAPTPAVAQPTTNILSGTQGQTFGATTSHFGPFAVGGLGGVVIRCATDVLGTGGVALVLIAFTDQPNGQQIAQRTMIVNAQSDGTIRMPIYAPYLTVSVTMLSGIVAQTVIFGVSAPVTAETWSDGVGGPGGPFTGLGATTGVILDGSATSVPNGSTQVVGTSVFTYAGPAVAMLSGPNAFTWRFDFMDNTGAMVNKWNLQGTDLPAASITPAGGAASPNVNEPQRFAVPMLIPARPWQIRVTNSSGATANFTAYVVGDHR